MFLQFGNRRNYTLPSALPNYPFDLMNSAKSIIPNFESLTNNNRIDIVLYGDSRFDENKNKIILEATMNYFKNSESISASLFEGDFHYVMISPIQTYRSITFKPLLVRNHEFKS